MPGPFDDLPDATTSPDPFGDLPNVNSWRSGSPTTGPATGPVGNLTPVPPLTPQPGGVPFQYKPGQYDPTHQGSNQVAKDRAAQDTLDYYQNMVENATPRAAMALYHLARAGSGSPINSAAQAINAYRRETGQAPLTDEQMDANDPAAGFAKAAGGAANAPAMLSMLYHAIESPGKTGHEFVQGIGDQAENIFDPRSTLSSRAEGLANTAMLLYGGYQGLKGIGNAITPEIASIPENWTGQPLHGDVQGPSTRSGAFTSIGQAQNTARASAATLAPLRDEFASNYQPDEPEVKALLPRNPTSQPKTTAAFRTADGHVYQVYDDGSTSHYIPAGPNTLQLQGRTPYIPGKAITPEATPETPAPALLARNPQQPNPYLDTLGGRKIPTGPKALMEQNPVKPVSTFDTMDGEYAVGPNGQTSKYVQVGNNTLQLQSKSQSTVYVDPDSFNQVTKAASPDGRKMTTFQDPQTGATKVGVQYTKGSWAGRINPSSAVETSSVPKAGFVPVETFANGAEPTFGSPIIRLKTADEAAQPVATAAPVATPTPSVSSPEATAQSVSTRVETPVKAEPAQPSATPIQPEVRPATPPVSEPVHRRADEPERSGR